jgi:hypothetical protein
MVPMWMKLMKVVVMVSALLYKYNANGLIIDKTGKLAKDYAGGWLESYPKIEGFRLSSDALHRANTIMRLLPKKPKDPHVKVAPGFEIK